MQNAELPKGYQAVDRSELSGKEVVDLYVVSHERRRTRYDANAEDLERWMDDGLYVVGIRSSDGLLVGVGFLEGRADYGAWLEGLAIHPEHRHRGLGKFIIDRRITMAHELGIDDIQSALDTTNTLATYYGDQGVITRKSSPIRLVD